MSKPVRAANQILDELRISQEDLVKYLDEITRVRGALVAEGNLSGSEARLNMAGKPAIITVSKKLRHDTHKRFGVAHELGHLEMHRWKVTLCSSADMMEWSVAEGSENLEQEANEFAAALLMPERYFASLCEEEPALEYFSDLADQFRVSLTAASIRYCNFTPEPMAIVFSQDGYIKWFRASKEFEDMRLFVNVRSRVYSGSHVAKFFQGMPIVNTPKRISAEAWLRPGDYEHDATVQEQSWSIDSYNAVLTILRVDEDVYGSEDDW